MQSTFLWTLSHLHTDLSGLLRVYGFVMGLQIAAGCCNRTGAEWQTVNRRRWHCTKFLNWNISMPLHMEKCNGHDASRKFWFSQIKTTLIENERSWNESFVACVPVSTSTLNSAMARAWNPDLDPIRTWIVNNRIEAAFRDKVIVVDTCPKVNILKLKFNYTR